MYKKLKIYDKKNKMIKFKAKIEILLRYIGIILILFSFIFSIILDFFLFNIISYCILLIIIIPLFLIMLLNKIEFEIIVRYINTILVIISLNSIVISILTINLNYLQNISLFIIAIFSNLLIIICWNYSFSIYKKKKIIFLICGFLYCVLTAFYKLTFIIRYTIWLIGIIPLFLIILGILLIIICEFSMRLKNLFDWL